MSTMARALCKDYEFIYLKEYVIINRAVEMLMLGALKSLVEPTRAGITTGR